MIEMKKVKLTKMIFDYWKHYMKYWDAKNNEMFNEGIGYYDGYHCNFWYLLNHEWYRMNDKLYAATGSKEKFEILRDFDKDYLEENNYV